MKQLLFSLAVAASLPLFAAETSAASSVAADIRESVRDGWKGIVRYSGKVAELTDEMKSLPESSFWFWETDRRDQRKKIRCQLEKVRELLLSTNARKLLKEVDEIDEKLASVAEDVREVTEERMLDPDEAEACDKKLAKLNEEKAKLEGRRAARAKVVLDELRALGLSLSGEAAERCLFPVNFDDLVDGVVVSRNIAAVVENLRMLMKDGEVDASRRYFGVYLTMVEVQVACYEDYLEKSRHGEWRKGLQQILQDATAARDNARRCADMADFTPEQRQIFVHNAGVNETTVQAAQAYLGVLDAHEKVIADKLAAAERVRKVVANSYETVSLAGAFISFAKANQEAFDSLLLLDLPPVETFNDETMQQEFLSITKKLKED